MIVRSADSGLRSASRRRRTGALPRPPSADADSRPWISSRLVRGASGSGLGAVSGEVLAERAWAVMRRSGVEEGLDLEELAEADRAELPPEACLLVAAEGRGPVGAAAVHRPLPGAQAPGDAGGALGVSRPDAPGEAVDAVVGDAHGVVLVVVRQDRQHRAED